MNPSAPAPLPASSPAPSAALRWAVIGPGHIAARFAAALHSLGDDARLALVLGRDAGRAADFAARWSTPGQAPAGVATALGALQAQRGEIDAVYVATPHAGHAKAVRAALLAGLPVLCEKPLVPNRAQGEALVALARERGLFLMEAVWTRYLPIYAQVAAWLRDPEQGIGALRGLQSSFCFPARFEPGSRLFDPAQAGGALLDLGVYNLNLTRWVLAQSLGACPAPQAIEASGVLAPTGVDQRVAATLRFPGGIASQFVCGLDGLAENALHVFGERGTISITGGFWHASQAQLQRSDGAAPLQVLASHRCNGFEYEIEEAQRCIRAGLIESPAMPHADTLATLGWMDEIRAQLGVRYPFE